MGVINTYTELHVIYIYIYTHTHTYIYACMYIYIRIYVCVCVYIYSGLVSMNYVLYRFISTYIYGAPTIWRGSVLN